MLIVALHARMYVLYRAMTNSLYIPQSIHVHGRAHACATSTRHHLPCFKSRAVADPHPHCCRLDLHSCEHGLEDCTVRRLELTPLQLAAVQPSVMREHQHQRQQGRHALQQQLSALESGPRQSEAISRLHIQRRAGEQMCISIRSACDTATDVVIQLRPVTTADQPHGAQQQQALASHPLPRRAAAVSSRAHSGSMWLRRRLQQQRQEKPQQLPQRQGKPPWPHTPEVCCCPPASGGNATTVLTKKAHVPPDGHCCCGTFKWALLASTLLHCVTHLCARILLYKVVCTQ